MASRIRDDAASYMTAAKDIAAGNAESDRKVGDFQKGIEDLKDAEEKKTEDGQAKNEKQDSPQPPTKHKGRSKNPKPPKPDSVDGEPS